MSPQLASESLWAEYGWLSALRDRGLYEITIEPDPDYALLAKQIAAINWQMDKVMDRISRLERSAAQFAPPLPSLRPGTLAG